MLFPYSLPPVHAILARMGISLGSIKRFLHSDAAASMARQALGIPVNGDAEANEKQSVNLPAPVRTITTNQPPVVPPPAIPAPIRTPSPDIGPPPDPALMKSQAGLAGVEQVYGNMYPTNPAIPPPMRTALPTGEMPAAPVPTGAPLPAPVRNVPTGPNLAGMSPAERAAALSQTLQTTDPMSKVRVQGDQIDVGPPHKMSHLKAMGKMFLQRMLAGSQYGIGGMLGAGAEGAIEGGVSPGHAQNVLRKAEIEKAQGDQNVAQTLESRGLQNEAAKLNIQQDREQILNAPKRQTEAEYQRERTDLEQNVQQLEKVRADDPRRAAYLDAINTEAERLSKKYGRTVTVIPGDGREPPRLMDNGEVIEFGPDGKPHKVYGEPKTDLTNQYHDQESDYTYQQKVGEASTKRAAAQLAAEQAKATAEDHQKKVSAAAGALTTLDAQMAAMSATVPDPSGALEKDNVTPKMIANPALGPLKRQRQQLKEQQASAEAAMNQAYKDQRKAEADAAGVYVPPPPPKRGKKTETGQAVSKSAWLASHPGGDWSVAEAEANRRQLPIIP